MVLLKYSENLGSFQKLLMGTLKMICHTTALAEKSDDVTNDTL
jgi:hypothetical protein